MLILKLVIKERNGKREDLVGKQICRGEHVRKRSEKKDENEKKDNGFFTKDKMALVFSRRKMCSLLGKNGGT